MRKSPPNRKGRAPYARKRSAPHGSDARREYMPIEEACAILDVSESKMRGIIKELGLGAVKVRGVWRLPIADFRHHFPKR